MGFRKVYFLNLKLSILLCIQNPAPTGILFYASLCISFSLTFSLVLQECFKERTIQYWKEMVDTMAYTQPNTYGIHFIGWIEVCLWVFFGSIKQ